MSSLDDLFANPDNADSALISLDVSNAIYVTEGLVGTGTWYREPCKNPDCPNTECKQGGWFKVISLLMKDVEGEEHTVIVPVGTQFSQLLLDEETRQDIIKNLED